jgi:hypothetical protein
MATGLGLVSAQHKRIALVDRCRSADGLPDQLTAAGTRKQQKYNILVEALQYYSDNGGSCFPLGGRHQRPD